VSHLSVWSKNYWRDVFFPFVLAVRNESTARGRFLISIRKYLFDDYFGCWRFFEFFLSRFRKFLCKFLHVTSDNYIINGDYKFLLSLSVGLSEINCLGWCMVSGIEKCLHGSEG
jgi:hypothetical protein